MKISSIVNSPEKGTELQVEFDCGCIITESHNFEAKFSLVCEEHPSLADWSVTELLDGASG